MAKFRDTKLPGRIWSNAVIFFLLVLYFGPASRYPLNAIKTAATSVYVAIVLDFGNGPSIPSAPVADCVSVPQGSSLLDALTQAVGASNLTFASSGLLCTIDGYPTTQVSPSCGQAIPGGYRYWSFWTTSSGNWTYAKLGPASIPAVTGAVEGWRFEYNGTGNPNDTPPAIAPNFQAICPGVSTSSSASTTSTTSSTTTTQPVVIQSSPTTAVAPTTTTALGKTATSVVSPTSNSSTTTTQPSTTSTTTSEVAPATSTTSSIFQGKTPKPKSGNIGSAPTSNSLSLALITVALLGGGGFGYIRLRRR